MKFLLLIYYFSRSVFLRGPINTIQLLRMEIVMERKFAIKTATFKKSDSPEFFHYQGASYMVLFRIFKDLFDQTKQLCFVDIGCGKGRAIFVAEYCGYNHLTGIEMDLQLLNEARNNETIYALKRETSTIKFVLDNALNVDYKNTPTLYFLFNPFNEEVLAKVLDKISAATKSETWFVYMNPLFLKPFADKKFELMKKFKTGRYLEAIVYKLNPV